jgi:PST family polysaccharide transporter
LTRALTVLLSIATARALEPREVGVLGLGVILIGAVSMLGFYTETAAVTASGARGDGAYAFSATVIRAALIGSLLIGILTGFSLLTSLLVVSQPAAGELGSLLQILILIPIFEVLGSYPQIVLQRRLELGYLSVVQMLQPIIFVGLAIGLLIAGSGYLGVAWASFTSSAVTTTLVWFRLARMKGVSWEGSRARGLWTETFTGSTRVFVGGFGGYLSERVDNLLVAATIGPALMSFYSMAWNASRLPANVLARAISFVLVPTLARIREDKARVERAVQECLRNGYLLLVPACAVLFVSAPLLVSFVLGAKWLPLVPCLRIMCITVLVAPVLYVSGALLVGAGRAHLAGIGTVAHLVTLGLLVPIMSTRWGIVGAAYAEMAATFVLTIVLVFTAHRATQQLNASSAATMVLPVVAGLAAGAAAWVVSGFIAPDLARLICELSVILIGYPVFILLLGGRSRLFDLTGLLWSVFRRPVLAAGSNG